MLAQKKDSNQVSVTQEKKEKEKERVLHERDHGPKVRTLCTELIMQDEQLEKILEIQKKKREATKVHVYEHTGTFVSLSNDFYNWEGVLQVGRSENVVMLSQNN